MDGEALQLVDCLSMEEVIADTMNLVLTAMAFMLCYAQSWTFRVEAEEGHEVACHLYP